MPVYSFHKATNDSDNALRALNEEGQPKQTEQGATDLEHPSPGLSLCEEVVEPLTGEGPQHHGGGANGHGDDDDG